MAHYEVRCPTCQKRNRVPKTASGRPRCGGCRRDLPSLFDVDASELDRVVNASSLPVLVDLWAPWCGPCRVIAPMLEQLASRRAGSLRIVKVDIDQHPVVSARLGVQSIPTMVLFSGGEEVARQVGALPAERLTAWIDGALGGARAGT